MKRYDGDVDAVPSKRLFLSIIADYDLNRSICELVDNGLDVWTRGGKAREIMIDIWLDQDERTIVVEDNAGGLARGELSYIVGPGQSGSAAPNAVAIGQTASTDETIGIFGVGTKRAVVALSKDIAITTRHGSAGAFQIAFDESWLNRESWLLQVHEVDGLAPGVTRVELQKLRLELTDELESNLRHHLGATYGRFLNKPGVTLRLNDEKIEPRFFEQWSYPPQHGPRRFSGQLTAPSGRVLTIDILAGLSNESSPATGEYGVYFYCNDRLVAPAMKSFEVGFTKGQAGVPHPKLSLTKIIVSISGHADEMPWNSSKSDINSKHHVFVEIREWLVDVVKHYAAYSRGYMGDWVEKVFPYTKGTIETHEVGDFLKAKKATLPAAPKSRPRYAERVNSANHAVAKSKPHVISLFEGVVASKAVSGQTLVYRNWFALSLLETTMIAAFKAYLVNHTRHDFSDKELHGLLVWKRSAPATLQATIKLPSDLWTRLGSIARLKYDLMFSKAEPRVSDKELSEAEAAVEELLKRLFKLDLDA
ncbi:ATP-binding protein [Brevundimonas sp. 374]|uniref:ATP-binding protein n=1 Tax=Brevundimonas sp. 374 TaxID=1150400 RepID=UPI00088C6AAD|nr:ATP-binding protein [Brevundimonas sp. 374]SDQ28036.1 Histidine kinase-, DNA gyrase B-, and HSP90-like ATPase [Brevundimonas sp. 374]